MSMKNLSHDEYLQYLSRKYSVKELYKLKFSKDQIMEILAKKHEKSKIER